MSLEPKIMREVFSEKREEVRAWEEEQQNRIHTAYEKSPRLRELDHERRRIMAQLVTDALRKGQNAQEAVQKAKKQSGKIQEEENSILLSMGLPVDYLVEKPLCGKCNDTGWVDGKLCSCVKDKYVKRQKEQLSSMLDIAGQSFECFNENLFDTVKREDGLSERELMTGIRNYCQDFCRNFENNFENIFFTGQCGTGKTFLSGCIAREVSSLGYSVSYDTAVHVFDLFEASRFGHDQNAAETISRYLESDLLILDDLGTEFTSPFIVSALYTIVNQRLVTRKSTIISTNLTLDELTGRYSAQIHSRIAGNYRILYLRSHDLRLG